MKLTLGKILIGLAAVALIAFLSLYFFLGSIVKTAIEKVGPEMTKTAVTVGHVGLSPLTGKLRIRKFFVGNPEGFPSPSAMKFGSFKLDVAVSSLSKNVIIIHSAVIDSPEITYEKGPGGTNFAVIQKNIESFSKNLSSEKATSSAAPPKKVIIEDLQILNAKAMAFGFSIVLADIHLKNLGKDSGGMEFSEAADRVLQSLTSGIGLGLNQITNTGRKVVKGVEKNLRKLFRK